MASSIRNRRTAIAAGVLSVALVAPFAPGVSDVVVPVAVAAPAWEGELVGFDARHTVEIAPGGSANVPDVKVPAGAEVSKKGIGQAGWSVKNDAGTLRLTAPGILNRDTDVDIPVTIKVGRESVERTLKIAADVPEKAPGGLTGLVGTIANAIGGALGNLKLPPLVDAKVDIHDNPLNVTDFFKENGKDNAVNVTAAVSAPVSVPVEVHDIGKDNNCLLYTSPSPRDS